MRRAESGFVLVGVVVMVLALTILGLSLFSLSSYEAQFMARTMQGAQALQCAMGGLDRARFVLATTPDTLGMVKLGLPRDSVVWARATQFRPGFNGPDSSGPIDWGGNDVTIEVKSQVGGVTRFATSTFRPSPQTNYYKRLMSVGAGGILEYTNNGISGSCGTVRLGDSLWVYGPIVVTDEINPPGTWPACLVPLPGFGVNPRYVEPPRVATFLSDHVGTPVPSTTTSLLGVAGRVSYYTTAEPFQPDKNFSCYISGDQTVTVDGWAVWMFPHGFRIDGTLHVKRGADPNACLVMVARQGDLKQGSTTYRAGLWFFGGLVSEIPIILVTDDVLEIEQRQHPFDFSLALQFSAFANKVVLTGPTLLSPPNVIYLTLNYDAHTMDPLIDQLMSAGALPNSISLNPLAFRPGSWRASQ